MSKGKVLIVDDDLACRKACARTLSAGGFETAEAEDGESALELLKDSSYNVVVTDIMMPGISGLDVLRHVKKNTPECDVIIITAYPTLKTSVEALRVGATDYIAKPIDIEELNSKVEQCMKEQEATTQKQSGKEVFTSYEVSKLCSVTVPTVTNWVEEKILPAYKTPGGHRRIKREDLINFLKKYNMPIPKELLNNK